MTSKDRRFGSASMRCWVLRGVNWPPFAASRNLSKLAGIGPLQQIRHPVRVVRVEVALVRHRPVELEQPGRVEGGGVYRDETISELGVEDPEKRSESLDAGFVVE